jgi:hypothetical protein
VYYYESLADYYDGGEGRDLLVYGTGRTSTVDLAAGTARRDNGEVSTVLGVEDVQTGPGDNFIAGDDGANELDGGPGADVIDGRGGADVIIDREGADSIRGGPGDDRILSADLYRDGVDCGAGADQLASDRADIPQNGCEASQVVSFDVVPDRLRVRGGSVLIAPRCFGETRAIGLVTEGLGTCAFRFTLRLRVGRSTVTAGSASCTNPFDCTYSLPLNRQARALLRRHSLPGTVEVVRSLGGGGIPMRERVTVVRGR